jgi:hypothetical protein
MNKDLWKNILIPTLLVLLFFVSLGIFKSEFVSTIILITCIVITFSIKNYENEWLLLVVGIIVGALFEIGGDWVYKLQYWEMNSFFGLPYWLPLLWGLGFIVIHRIGSMIVIAKK